MIEAPGRVTRIGKQSGAIMPSSVRCRFRSLRIPANCTNAGLAARQQGSTIHFEDRRVHGTDGKLAATLRVRIANGIERVLARTTYDATGRASSYTGGDGLVTEYTCDSRGRLIQTRRQTADSSGKIQWLVALSVYDAADRIIATTDEYPEGTTNPIPGTRITYDAMGRTIHAERFPSMIISLTGSGANATTALTVVRVADPDTKIAPTTSKANDHVASVSAPEALHISRIALDLGAASDNAELAEHHFAVRADGRRSDLVEMIWTATGSITDIFHAKYDDVNRHTHGSYPEASAPKASSGRKSPLAAAIRRLVVAPALHLRWLSRNLGRSGSVSVTPEKP